MANIIDGKQCIRCDQYLNFSEFYHGKNVCKICRRYQIKKWFRDNPFKLKAYNIKHYVKQKYGEDRGSLTGPQIERLLRRYKSRCGVCRGRFIDGKYQIDHIVPLMLGGRNQIRNLQPVHQFCNAQKSKIDGTLIPNQRKTVNEIR